MIEIAKALQIIGRETRQLGSETVPIDGLVGCVLAEDIIADTDLPPFDRSQMDGFAVVADDIKNTPATLSIVGESAAGRGWHHKLQCGEAVRIMTGAPVPVGADAVQKVEAAREFGGVGAAASVELLEPTAVGRHIVRKGSEIKKGTRIFARGDIVYENMIAAIASFGYSRVKVAKRPRVAIVPTGSEIVDISKKPGRDQIRNSNSVMLDALCRKFCSLPVAYPIAMDDISLLTAEVETAAKNADILVLTGGVSVGKYDLTKAALRGLGAEIFFERVRLKPGKPTVFARLGKTVVFGLPGNPVSAATAFFLFVVAAIRQLQKAKDSSLRKGVGIATETIRGTKERDSYVMCRMSATAAGGILLEPLKTTGSSDLVTLGRADCMALVPRGIDIEIGYPAHFLALPGR